jgi:N-acetylglucosamine-6-phosphate deacetylase
MPEVTHSYIVTGSKIYTEAGVLDHHALVVREGKIAAVVQQDAVPTDLPVHRFSSDTHLIPGMIDMHIHGSNGADVMDGSLESLQTISQSLFKEGVTGYLATTMTETTENIERALATVKTSIEQPLNPNSAAILGIHLEGPFLSYKQMGAQQGELIRAPDIALFDRWQGIAGGHIRMVTIAPELTGAIPFIKHLVKSGVIASIGHTDATYEQTQAAIDAGATHATHLFNAMRGIHHREPGTVTALLLDDRVATEIIADGIHLNPAVIQLTVNIKGKDRLILVTDAMRAKCCGEGVFDLGGQAVTVHDGSARLANGVLAGSVLMMHQALMNMLRFTDCSLYDLVPMVSATPAKQLGKFDQLGSIAVGKAANWVVLDAHHQVVRVNN